MADALRGDARAAAGARGQVHALQVVVLAQQLDDRGGAAVAGVEVLEADGVQPAEAPGKPRGARRHYIACKTIFDTMLSL